MNRWKKVFCTLAWAMTLLLAGCRGAAAPATPLPTTPPPAAVSNTPAQTLTAASAGGRAAAPVYWPTDGWRRSSPEEQGMDGGKLAQAVERVEGQRLDLHSLLVIRNGYLVSENYFQGYTARRRHELYSCTKSFIATLVGMAIERGAMDGIYQSVLSFFPEQSFANPGSDKDAITLKDLLTMTPGLDWEEGDAAYRALYSSQDWVKYMLDLPMREPPSRQFNYCSGCSHLLSAVLQRQMGMSAQDFAQKYLFEPLGIRDYRWDRDSQGISLGGWGLQLTPGDMAKLGYLYLHEGQWDGQQIVPADWVRQATREHVASDAPGRGYGYQWWTYPSLAGYAALGRGGQAIFVVPGWNLIVVTTAQDVAHEQIFRLIEEGIVPAIR